MVHVVREATQSSCRYWPAVLLGKFLSGASKPAKLLIMKDQVRRPKAVCQALQSKCHGQMRGMRSVSACSRLHGDRPTARFVHSPRHQKDDSKNIKSTTPVQQNAIADAGKNFVGPLVKCSTRDVIKLKVMDSPGSWLPAYKRHAGCPKLYPVPYNPTSCLRPKEYGIGLLLGGGGRNEARDLLPDI